MFTLDEINAAIDAAGITDTDTLAAVMSAAKLTAEATLLKLQINAIQQQFDGDKQAAIAPLADQLAANSAAITTLAQSRATPPIGPLL